MSTEITKGKLYFTIGCPRSGKSTYCEKWVDEPFSEGMRGWIEESRNTRRVIVSSDDIRLSLNGKRYEPLAETMVFAIKHVMIRSLLSRGFDVIVDGTHSTKISIQRLLEIEPNAIPILIDTPRDICKERAKLTGKEDLIPVIDRIYDNIQEINKVGLENYIAEIIAEINKRGLYEACRTV